jgi:hypothetical protein
LHHSVLRQTPSARLLLSHRIYNEDNVVIDSVLIDGYNLIFTPNGGGDMDRTVPNVAGVFEAANSNILVRKSNISHGNLNWDVSAGVSAEDSEWMCIPYWTGRNIWTTVGVHGNYTVAASSETIGINMLQETMSVPWGTYKINNGDSIINRILNLGPGMAWRYVHNSANFPGGGHTICQDSDTLILYATGDVLDVKEFSLSIQPPTADETRVFPKRTIDILPDEFGNPQWGGVPYYVTNFESIMDTVGNLPFAVRQDTVYKYLEKAEKASWEIIWIDGHPRVDLKNGDILRITAENGIDTKDYYLDILPLSLSSNANLASITWPDKPGFLMGWVQDTIPSFAPLTRLYNILIPYQTESVPALQVTTQNPNAKVQMFPAEALDGTTAQRTTQIQITAQDDTTVVNYYVTFNKEKPSFLIQPWLAEPIISEIVYHSTENVDGWLEIYNPGTEPIDLANYMIMVNKELNPAEAISKMVGLISDKYSFRYHWPTCAGYIPGFKWPASKEDWDINPGYVVYDPVVDPILDPGKVFLLGTTRVEKPEDPNVQKANVMLGLSNNSWGETDLNVRSFLEFARHANTSIYIMKILNDSIHRGLKAVEDPADFELVERFGYSEDIAWNIAGKTMQHPVAFTIIRKPHIITPSTEIRRGWGTNADDSDWFALNMNDEYEGVIYTREMVSFDLGIHNANPGTHHISTILSNVYKVDGGYQGDLSIRGVSYGESVQAFLNNLIRANEGQTLVVSAVAGGPAKELTEAVDENDVLTVTSANDENQTSYSISISPLDGNNTLSLITGSDLIIAREGNTGTISGFPFGTTIMSVFQQVEKPVYASLRIVNASNELLPMMVMNKDTVKVSTVIDSDVHFMVTAENGDVALYHLQSSSLASDAYVLSDLYVIDQAESTISAVPGGTTVSTFYAALKTVTGATMQVRDKKGVARESGTVRFDDFLFVTSEDKSETKVYFIQMANDPDGLKAELRLCPDPSNLALANVSSDGTEVTLVWDYDSGLELGFVVVRDGAVIDTVVSATFTDKGLTKGATYEYSVYAYNEFGNSGSQTLSVHASPVAIDHEYAEGISIFPTVTNNMIYFRNLHEGSQVYLTDLAGKTILIKRASELSDGLSLQPYAKGYYLIKVIHEHEFVQSVKVLRN